MAGWFEVKTILPGVTRISEPFVHPMFSANMYHVSGRDVDLVIDTGMGLVPLRPVLPPSPGKPVLAVATHVHLDHVGGLHEFTERAGPAAEMADFETMSDEATFAHEFRTIANPVSRLPYAGWKAADYRIQPAPLGRALGEGDRVDLGDRSFAVLHLPGHSPGCLALLDERDGLLFSGDAIYDDELLDDLPCSDRQAYRETMRRLLSEVSISSGHGGHGPAFDEARMRQIARDYLERTGGT